MRVAARWIAVVQFVLLVLLAPLASANDRVAVMRAFESIQADQLGRHVEVLADDTFEGREAGSRGGRAAAGYLVGELQRHKLRPAGVDGGYRQPLAGGANNILAMVEGRDPALRHQVILLGAHYDHVGYGTSRNSYGPTGYIHNGADDNASGTSGLLEMAKTIANLPEAPRRTMLFAFWDGEEKGLIGSKHWTANPTVPLSQIALAINVDMIGRLKNQTVEIAGSRTGFGLRQLVSRANEGLDLNLDFAWKLEANSDHYSFYERRVPILMLHTGLHDDYHRPSDDAHKVNREGMQQVTRLLFNIAYELAEREEVTGFRTAVSNEPVRSREALEARLPDAAPRLGVAWNREPASKTPGVIVTTVAGQSPAAAAGLQVGDRLLAFNRQPIITDQWFRLAVLASEGDAVLTVQSGVDREPRDVALTLAGRPTRLGISWNSDDAEPGSVILTRVIAGSAAAVAGLQPGDRVYELNGQTFGSSEHFKQLTAKMPGPLDMLVERTGRLRRVELPVIDNVGAMAVAP